MNVPGRNNEMVTSKRKSHGLLAAWSTNAGTKRADRRRVG
jgi:hypothetical protein